MPGKQAAALAIQMVRGILSMGWALWSRDHVSNPTLEVHPHDPSRPFRLAFRTVNLKVADLAQFGTIPSRNGTTRSGPGKPDKTNDEVIDTTRPSRQIFYANP